ncbi:hypothetical protein [Actinoallomurus sp. CA-142502]|uniref:hypothetical protein n=1 Tax=Actinoallomurus sp. CA-142502 TaxID=3239885 RepID=UPI003D8EA612
MQQETPQPSVQQRDGTAPSSNEHVSTPGLMAVVNAMLVGVPAAYAASRSVLITVITGAIAFGVVLMWRWIR